MASPDPDVPLLKVDNGQDVAAFTWSANQAADNARQHNGNVYITNSHTHLADPSDKSLDGLNLNAALLLAASRGKAQRVKYLLGKNASFDHKDENGMTALHHASLSGFEEVVKLLIQKGADVDAHSSLYGSALCLAILKDRVNVTRVLLEERPHFVQGTDGIGTELHCACWTGRCDIAAMLLRSGAAVNNKANIYELRMKLLYDHGTVGLSDDVRQRIESSPKISCFPLSLAVLRGHLELTELLLENGALVDEDCVWFYPRQPVPPPSSSHRATSVIIAATHGHHEILKLLIDRGANLGIRNSEGRSALAIAADKGDEKCVGALLNASKIQSSTDRETAFHLATSGGHTKCVRVFCDSNIDVDAVNEDDHTALRVAAQNGDLSTANVLLNAGAKVDGKSTVGSSPLTIAAEQGHVQIVELLLNHGASVATPKHDTGTLFSAALGHIDSPNGHAMLQALLRPKPDDPVSERDLKDILAVLQKGKGSSREEVSAAMVVAAACAGNESSLKSLHRVGADLNSRFSDGQTALHRVARDRHFTGTLRLLNLGAQVNVFDQHGFTPLMNAIKEGQVQMVEELIRQGANVNDQAKSGLTPVHLAVGCNATEALTALLCNGADTSSQDLVQGNTPLHQAASVGNRAAARLLLQYKADIRIKNKDGHTAEDIAYRYAHHDVCVVLEEFRGPAEEEHGVAGQQQRSDDALQPEPGADKSSDVETEEFKPLEDDDGSTTLADTTIDEDVPSLSSYVPEADDVEKSGSNKPHVVTPHGSVNPNTDLHSYISQHEKFKLGLPAIVKVDKIPSEESASPEITRADKELSDISTQARKSDERDRAGHPLYTILEFDSEVIETYLQDFRAVEGENWTSVTFKDLQFPWRTSKFRYTVLHIAPWFRDKNLAKDVVERALASGADVDAVDFAGNSPLHHAAATGASFLVGRLLQAGAAPSQPNERRRRPLHLAAEAGNVAAMKSLLLFRAGKTSIDARDDRGDCALHLAARHSSMEAIKTLLKAGASPQIKDGAGLAFLALCHGDKKGNVQELPSKLPCDAQSPASEDWSSLDADTPNRLEDCDCMCEPCRILSFVKFFEGRIPVLDGRHSGHYIQLAARMLSNKSQLEDDLRECVCGTCTEAKKDDCEDKTSRDIATRNEISERPAKYLNVETSVRLGEAIRDDSADCSEGLSPIELNYITNEDQADQSQTFHSGETNTSFPAITKVDKELSEILERARKSDESGKAGAHDALVNAGFSGRKSYVKNPSKAWLWAISLCRDDYDDLGLRAIVKLLLEHNAAVDARSDFDRTILHWAAGLGKIATADLLIARGTNIDTTTPWVRTRADKTTYSVQLPALRLAVLSLSPSLPMLRLLLLAGANIDHLCEDNINVLQEIVNGSSTCNFLPFILEHKPSLDVANRFGNTALRLAIWRDLPEAVQLLIRGGASVNYGPEMCTKDGKPVPSPLNAAVLRNNPEILRILLEHGARYSHKVGNQRLIVSAAWSGKGTSIKFLLDWAKEHPAFREELYVNFAVTDDAPNRVGETPLHLIATAPAPQIEACLVPLIEFGADVNALDLEGDTPLHKAANAGSAYMVGVLKTHNVDLQKKNNAGKTALDLAIEMRHKEATELLGGKLSEEEKKKKKWYKV